MVLVKYAFICYLSMAWVISFYLICIKQKFQFWDHWGSLEVRKGYKNYALILSRQKHHKMIYTINKVRS